MLFKYLRAERGRPEYLLGRAFAAAGFFFRTIAYTVRFFPWTRGVRPDQGSVSSFLNRT
jgi:hypothetical protein